MSKIKGKEELSEEQYAVCWQQATERPYTGKYLYHHEQGLYHCVCCDAPLFASQSKFESGCGWPSFFEPVSTSAIRYLDDLSHGMSRIEVRCGACDSHLGHVFDDGPQPTGQRYCINSLALTFEPEST